MELTYILINQLNPQIQYGAYVYNQYRRSLDGGQTWGSVNVSSSAGLFINPFDMDDAQYIFLYGCYSANNYLRMSNTNTTAPINTTVALTALGGGLASAIKVSPYTINRLFIGSTNGKVLKVDNANATPTATDITGAGMAGYINCVNTGMNDNNLVSVFTNYGVNNVWVTSDGGTTWSAIDGNLPDMPVRWALFEPGRNDRLIIATEAGVYSTDQINGASTIWMPHTTFPTVRTDMLKMRAGDSTVVAATHGRGLFTAKISAFAAPQVSFLTTSTATTERTDGSSGCRNYADYTVNIGLTSATTNSVPVIVNLNVLPANTAVEGVDFDITTNGSFANPSKQIIFSGSNSETKTFTIRVYDDKEIESTENFKLSFSVSGTSNAVAGLLTTHDLTIGDNDRHPAPYQQGSYALGTYDIDLSATSPFNGTKLRNRLQVLYMATELRAVGFTLGGKITAIKLRVKSKSSTTPFNGFSISMMNSNATTLSSAFLGGGTIQQVYSANYTTVVGDNNFTFNTPFVWDGVSNISVQFCYDNTGGTAATAADVVEGMGTPLGTGVR
ncbi:MAG: hypothetical protein C4330_00850 [Chitinophagaceae bacterium]